jgi:cellulose synthase/poly-beta-1,6-N-acetylglucosamine synthase-like glycosyltransferase
MVSYLATISLLSILYAYFGYPAILYFFDQTTESENNYDMQNRPSSVSIIIAARNEEKSIRDKILNTLALSFEEHTVRDELKTESPGVQVLIADDASDDNTASIAGEFSDTGIQCISLRERGGKEKALQNALTFASGEIVIFTDAKVELSDTAVTAFLHYFSDPAVGAVSSIDKVIDESGVSGEGAYVRYEMKIREMESRVSTLVGLSGSCFAVRKEITEDLDVNVASDFSLLFSSVRRGLRGRHAPEIVGHYKAVRHIEKEFERKVRTVSRGIHALYSNIPLLNPAKYGFFSFQLISHKLYRWFVPVFFILLFFSSYSLSEVTLWRWVWYAQSMLLFLATAGYVYPGYRTVIFCKIPMFFIASNLAILLAWFQILVRRDIEYKWNPSDKG